ncbi:MAG: hypothetical protein QOJ32_237 [Frankiaceae bacterium]|jgi:hypothetical protein|nr:hypothetical protein [Frankiaceae bacterium]MDQ1673204.1 hypothetical protein [Frankiaceae bacterium]
MTTPDSTGTSGATGTGTGGLAAGPGDDSGDAAVAQEATTGRASGTMPGGSAAGGPATETASSAPGTSGGLGQSGEAGPDLTEQDEGSDPVFKD